MTKGKRELEFHECGCGRAHCHSEELHGQHVCPICKKGCGCQENRTKRDSNGRFIKGMRCTAEGIRVIS